MTEQIDMKHLRALAEKQEQGYAKMIRLNGGIGKLGVEDPELFEAMLAWDDATGNDHADTVLALLDEIERLRQVSPFTPPAQEDRDRVRRKLNELDKLRQERDELAAEVERLRGESDWEYGVRNLTSGEVFEPVNGKWWRTTENEEPVRRHPATEWEPAPEGEGDG